VNSRDTNNLPLAQTLTPREQDILNCIGDGLTNRQMAEHLTLAAGTVKWYVRQVYNKLGVNSRAEAVTRARSLGLLPAGAEEGIVRHNLLAAATPFIGRNAELDALDEFITDPHVRIITLTGPGGIGKTRLALETARRQIGPQTRFPDGIFFVALAPLESAEEILTTLAAVLDFHFQGSGNETEQLFNYLRNKQMLLVMDNFEHVLDGRTLLTQINEQAAQITLIVTSRERLLLRGEQLLPLNGLETVENEDTQTDSSAAQLFLHIARRTVPDFQFHAGDEAQLNRICRLVEGMPLGLELAASWVGLLPLSEIATEIEQSLTLLVARHHDVPERHQSMQAMLAVSWSMLNPQQQRAFEALTLFRGGFTRTAALQVAGATLPLLVTLVNKSWLAYEWQNDRYTIHELLRQFGASKLREVTAREQEARDRHSAFFYDYLKQQEADLFGARQQAAIAKVQDEIENIHSAWHWAVNQGEPDQSIKILSTLLEYYRVTGSFYDAIVLLNRMLDLLSRPPIQKPRIAFWIAIGLSEFYGHIGQFQLSKTYVRQAETILSAPLLHDKNAQAERAALYYEQGYMHFIADPMAAIELFRQGIQLFEILGDDIGMVRIQHGLARAARNVGNFDLAHQAAQRSLALSFKLNNPLLQIESQLVEGGVAYASGHFDEAEEWFQKSLLQIRRMKHPRLLGMGLVQLSANQRYAGRFEQALKTCHERQRLSEETDGSMLRSRCVEVNVRIHLGQYDRSAALVSEVLRIARDVGDNGAVQSLHRSLCMLALAKEDIAAAKSYATSVGDSSLWHMYPPIGQILFGLIAALESNLERARQHIVHAFGQNMNRRHPVFVGTGLAVAACVCVLDNQPEHAVSLYATACKIPFVANSRWFADVIGKRIASGVSALPREAVVAAEVRGQSLDIWEAVDEVLAA
jgi:predicted ATPase/DNA-binding CsgD family transcriptional regulator